MVLSADVYNQIVTDWNHAALTLNLLHGMEINTLEMDFI